MGSKNSHHQQIEESSVKKTSRRRHSVLSIPEQVTSTGVVKETPMATTTPYGSNAVLASPIPEIYYSNDMIYIDGPEPLLSIDPSIPSFVSTTGQVSQAVITNDVGHSATHRNMPGPPAKYLTEIQILNVRGMSVGRRYRCE